MSRVRVALAGVGNCASALVQGTEYYRRIKEEAIGLLAYDLGGITPNDIDFVAAFDVNDNKVGKDLSDAIAQQPNNTPKIAEVPPLGCQVSRGPVFDGIGKYMEGVITSSSPDGEDVSQVLKDSGAEILINYLPVGSTEATKYYAQKAIEAGVAFINAIPVFIASEPSWESRFKEKGLPVAGDDVMSQIGATVLHKSIVKLCIDRGVKVDETYQLNVGGDADFLNMLEESRLKDKRESKTSAVKAMTPYDVPTKIGPSDYIPFLNNDKVCYVWVKGRYFGNTPVMIDLKLHVVDATNSAGVMIDAIRATKLALERQVSGALTSISAYCFKHPPIQMPYEVAKKEMISFIEGRKDR
ncbi:MAG: inositol-3-phosphate synthase [Nitrososphaerales archaeon]